ncbi:hypothetical protein MRB53_039262 [Persea americana]|nr:hypothetical protein MRB53_039262 [Persea americana]
MPLKLSNPIHFGNFVVNSQIFYVSRHSFAFVNLKPLMPGHVLVSPIRVVPRLADLSPPEVSDLFLAVQKVGRLVERLYSATALNIAIQDGRAAGQSVPHVHAHVIPRKDADLDSCGGSDAIYDMLDGEDGDLAKHQRERQRFPKPDETDRVARSDDEMAKEAEWLHKEMSKTEE